MAAKVFSLFISRLRRRVGERRLSEKENYTSIELQDNYNVSEVLVDDNCVTTNDKFSERGCETGTVNTVVTATENNYRLARVESENRTEGECGDATKIVERTKTKRFAVAGIALAIISSLLFSITSLLIKLAESIPSIEVASMRLIFQLVFSIPPLIFFKDRLVHPWKKTKFLILRGVSGATAMNLAIYAVKHMPMADARVIFYTCPVYTAFLGRIFLKETVTKFDLIATVLSLGGVVLIGRPTFLFGSLGKSSSSKQVWFPTLLAAVGALCAACAIVLTRKVSQEMPGRVVVFYSTMVGVTISFLALLISGGFKFPDCRTYDAYYVIVSGVIGYSGQLIVTKALSLEKASIISLVRTVGIVFSFVLQLVVLGVAPNGLSIGGAFLVLLCNFTIFIKKFLDQRKVKPLS